MNYHDFDEFILDRCDAKVSCYRINDIRNEAGPDFTLEDEVFTKCTTFNIHLEADLGHRVVRDDISLANKWVLKKIRQSILGSVCLTK